MIATETLILIFKQVITETAFILAREIGKLVGQIEIKNMMVKQLIIEFINGVTEHAKRYIPARMYKMWEAV